MQASRACTAALPALWALVVVSQGLWAVEALVDKSARRHSLGRSLQHPGHTEKPLQIQQFPGSLQKETFEHSHALEEVELLQRHEQGPTTTTTHKSWFQRLKDALWSVLVGLFVLIPFSIALLWNNERRNAQLESLISRGRSEAQTVETTQADLADYDGDLVHLNSDTAKGLDLVQDARFPDVKMESGCLRLMSTVEVYQWEEQKHDETKKDSLGGGETTTTTYTYSQVWSSRVIDSSTFKESWQHKNSVHVPGLDAGTREVVNSTVKYGEPYRLPTEMVQQLNNFEDAEKLVGENLYFHSGALVSYKFEQGGSGWYQCPVRSTPEIGDFRVKIQYVLDGPASILALQAKDKQHEGGRTFVPYRSVPRGCCGLTADSELKQRRLDASNKGADELYEEEKCGGPFACLCGCCNLVSWIFTHVQMPMFSLMPQIYSAWPGEKSIKECFNSETSAGMVAKWGLRFLGWLLLWVGFNMVLSPLEIMLDIIPFLGPYLGSGAAWALGLLSFLLTMAIATLIVSAAYLIYHPLLGLLYMVLAASIVAGVMVLPHMLEGKH